MRFWLDIEYDDSSDRTVLISLGAVAEDGREVGLPGHEALQAARGQKRIYDYLAQSERDLRSSD